MNVYEFVIYKLVVANVTVNIYIYIYIYVIGFSAIDRRKPLS